MTNQFNKLQDIVGYLSDQLMRGWASLLVAKYIQRAFSEQRLNSTRVFFTTAYLTSAEAAVLALSRISLNNKDSITFQYLLNVARENPTVFNHAEKEDVLAQVNKHQTELVVWEELFNNIRQQRDWIIAHLDKKFVTNPSAISAITPINFNGVENAFRYFISAVNSYKRMLDSSEIILEMIDEEIPGDLEYLLQLIEKDNNRN